ncbi:hypothetical protein CPB85DRAFT_1435042 [Mucidula mucida]|nr:hypothetical protein CPB85DRAFT_1435042 [Mucidula mucida]
MQSRRAKRFKKAVPPAQTAPKTCYFTKLPFELIADILQFTQSPRDVLALYLCNKYLRDTLLRKESDFIWRYMRLHCQPSPLPDKPSSMTEASYAALVFGGGMCGEPCEACGLPTDNMYSSFALRIRICKKPACLANIQRTMKKINMQDVSSEPAYFPIVAGSMFVTENSRCVEDLSILTLTRAGNWPQAANYVRARDWDRSVQDYLEATGLPETMEAELTERASRAQRVTALMPTFVALYHWKIAYDTAREQCKKANEEFAKAFAEKNGYAYWDLINSPSFSTIHKTKNKTLESITALDMTVLGERIDADIVKMKEQRERRQYQMDHAKAYTVVEKHYEGLRTKREMLPVPPFATFRKFRFIKTILNTPPSPAFNPSKQLKTPLAKTLIASELTAWRMDAKEKLGEVLGYGTWKAASKTRLHPVERVNARFKCQRCHHFEQRYRDDGCFNFIGACSHQCRRADGTLKNEPWSAERFVKDAKAVSAISKVLALSALRAESPESSVLFDAIGSRILCESCPGAIILQPCQVAGHSHRHDEMQVSFLSEQDASSILCHPLTAGLAQRLMGTELRAKPLRGQKVYMCRHCSQKREASTMNPAASSARSTTLSTGTGGSPEPLPQKAYIFDGLRSHLKASHGIEAVRDEDFYCSVQLDWSITKEAAS